MKSLPVKEKERVPYEQFTYPFSAIVGQEKLKLALILNAINPRVGGVLITGAKGTGKSLAARALAEILPEIDVAKGCPYNCSPTDPTNMCQNCRSFFLTHGPLPLEKKKIRIIQLPISATEDRVIGTLDTEMALKEGIKALQPGLLAEANQNILYIDDVNLLPDYLVNCLLDPAALGWNVVQREGISLTHPSRFTFVASMNPEEGKLRPQILDRFALHVNMDILYDHEQRMEIIRRNLAFEEDPIKFRKEYEDLQKRLWQRIMTARELLPKVRVPENLFESVAKVSSELEVEGHRPDIVTIKAAEALAAFHGRTVVEPEDVLTVSELALSHRARKPPLVKSSRRIVGAHTLSLLSRIISRSILPFSFILLFIIVSYLLFLPYFPLMVPAGGISEVISWLARAPAAPIIFLTAFSALLLFSIITPLIIFHHMELPNPRALVGGLRSILSRGLKISKVYQRPRESEGLFDLPLGRKRRSLAGKRVKTVTTTRKGCYVWCEFPKKRPWDIAFAPTIRVAAPHQVVRDRGKLAVSIQPQDVRVKVRQMSAPFTILLLIDMSESMTDSLNHVRDAVLSLHKIAYKKRDRVGLIVFKGSEATTLQYPTTNLNLVEKKLLQVGASGLSPLAAGMVQACRIFRNEKLRSKDIIPILIIVSDGIVNVPLPRPLFPFTRNRFLNIAQADVLDAAYLLSRGGIRTIIINPYHMPRTRYEKIWGVIPKETKTRELLPTELLLEIVRITGGYYYGIGEGGRAEAVVLMDALTIFNRSPRISS